MPPPPADGAHFTRLQSTAINELLADKVSRRTILGLRYDAQFSREVIALLNDLEVELLSQLVRADVTGVKMPSARRARLEKLLAEAKKEVAAQYRRINRLTQGELFKLAEIEATATGKLITDGAATVGVNLGASLPTQATFAALFSDPAVMGAPLSDWWAQQSTGAFTEFARNIRLGVTAGETTEQIAKRVAGPRWANLRGVRDDQVADPIRKARRGARALVRTSVASVQGTSRQSVYEANLDVIEFFCHVSRLDSRTSDICLARAGKRWDAETKKPVGHSLPFQVPPLHVNCLLGHSNVTPGGSVTGHSKRWMDGEIIVIRTASGRELSATPNHPILTDGGWRSASLLEEGNNIVCIGGADRALRSVGYDENVVAQIHEFAEAGFGSSEMLAVPVPMSAPDFHGDGTDSEVAIVTVNRSLLKGVESPLAKPKHHLPLGKRDYLVSFFGALPKFFWASLATLGGSVSRVEHSLSGIGIGVTPTFEHLSRNGSSLVSVLPSNCASIGNGTASTGFLQKLVHSADAYFEKLRDLSLGQSFLVRQENVIGGHFTQATLPSDAGLRQNALNGSWADAELIRDLLSRQSAEIEIDYVTFVSRREFKGHVYNLETTTGWYAAEGIITHNCRSVLVPVPYGGGQLAKNIGADEWIKGLSVSEQEGLLGIAKSKLFRDGKIAAKDLIDQSNRPLTLDELAAH